MGIEDNQELLLTLLIYYVLSKETSKGEERKGTLLC